MKVIIRTPDGEKTLNAFDMIVTAPDGTERSIQDLLGKLDGSFLTILSKKVEEMDSRLAPADYRALRDARASDETKDRIRDLLREPEVREALNTWECAAKAAHEVGLSKKLLNRETLVREWIRELDLRPFRNSTLELACQVAERYGKAFKERVENREDLTEIWKSARELAYATTALVESLRDESAGIEVRFDCDRWVKADSKEWLVFKPLYEKLGNDPEAVELRMLTVVQPRVVTNNDTVIPGRFA